MSRGQKSEVGSQKGDGGGRVTGGPADRRGRVASFGVGVGVGLRAHAGCGAAVPAGGPAKRRIVHRMVVTCVSARVRRRPPGRWGLGGGRRGARAADMTGSCRGAVLGALASRLVDEARSWHGYAMRPALFVSSSWLFGRERGWRVDGRGGTAAAGVMSLHWVRVSPACSLLARRVRRAGGVPAKPSAHSFARVAPAAGFVGCGRGVVLSLVGWRNEKGIWWMPWRREAMKDVARCDKPRGAASRL
jgi:hypothetical protein